MKNYKRIIFLDIDGVVTTSENYGRIDPNCVKKLNKLKDIDAEIVISSSWGYDEGRTEKTLIGCGLELPIVGYTDHYYEDWLCRGNEIEKWLRNNFGGMCTKYGEDYDGVPYYRKHYSEEDVDYEFVIFDDDADMLLGQKDNFIQTDEELGISDEDIEKARKILTRENVDNSNNE